MISRIAICAESFDDCRKIYSYIKDRKSVFAFVSYRNDEDGAKANELGELEQIDFVDLSIDSNDEWLARADLCIVWDESEVYRSIEKAFFLDDFILFYWGVSPERYYIMSQYDSRHNYEAVLLGMSYVQRGVDIDRMCKKTALLAAPAQDLFYDFEMLKYSLQGGVVPKYCIIGMAPYKLWYDMSLSKKNELRSIYYYPQTGTLHHYKNAEGMIRLFEYYKKLYDDIFEKELISDLFTEVREANHLYMDKDMNVWKDDSSNDETDRQFVESHYNKPYPETFLENLAILNDMVDYLEEKSIIPIFVIPPYTRKYCRYMNRDMCDVTVQELGKIIEKYGNVKVLNCIDDNDFDDGHFSDIEHLNAIGAQLLTDKINEMLMA